MGDRREQMTIVGPDFHLARLESGRVVNTFYVPVNLLGTAISTARQNSEAISILATMF